MAEPQPSNVQEGADAPDVVPASKEDRKAAAALSSLDANPTEDGKPKKETDLKALSEAMKNLDMTAAKPKPAGTSAVAKKEEAPKKLIKVDAADVTLLVDQLDLSKTKATDLLRAHDADALKAIKAWVTASG
ncbi:Putative nascent polypeptide-associated complex subunit alpha-like, UBA domain-containing protein [Septoria linicola]|uniref:Nascent polypeptide-associated complex subunit alpha-like, UBA domain-containing protein n=1 Tax=Septoria linicola TaxID=215465 RepID=A0A9Q9EFR6_9PEZI|nr:putative nascent polypeptide-associated complex subunit alpha-like, UBA domain-containing protein [Septoria linicola]USW47957.1 Putative nascent polypeptide-associated complex subunit alpha-like, UBA domain-containing protein [Septoria linicola]